MFGVSGVSGIFFVYGKSIDFVLEIQFLRRKILHGPELVRL
jgi:hypothetical protein